MLTTRELIWLHSLQGDLALKRDWIAVAHVQALIDHLSDTQGIESVSPFLPIGAATMN